MAGGGSGPSFGGGRRRSLDGEMNLVPFIDLLSMCICFLLMTAIWIEVGSIPLHQLLGTEAVVDPKERLEFQVKLQSPTSVQLSLEQQGRIVHQLAIDAADFEQLKSRISTSVGQVQSSLLSQNPDAEMSARLIPTASVDYGSMIAVLDILKGYGISALAVVPVRE